MSILLGPYDKSVPSEEKEDKVEDLFVFGYSCKLYRDDVKAILEDSGQLLIPWMGDNSLMIDRYDIRNRLDDKSQFGLKPNLPHRITREEEEFEEELDKERYLALEWDEIRVEEQEEEEKKRSLGYGAVGYSYNDHKPPETEEPAVLVCNPQLPEHPPTDSVDHGEDVYCVPEGLVLPEGMQTPATNKLHSIIEKTALFVSQQGTQMEIIIKAKQKFNPFFSFLDYKDALHPYYIHVKELLCRGVYVPTPPVQQVSSDGDDEQKDQSVRVSGPKEANETDTAVKETEHNGAKLEEESQAEVHPPAVVVTSQGASDDAESEDEGSSSDDEDGYLHPLLMRAMTSKSRTPTPVRGNSPQPRKDTDVHPSKIEFPSRSTSSSSMPSFLTKSYTINSAPSLEPPITTDDSNSTNMASQSHDQQHSIHPPQTAPGQTAYNENTYVGATSSYYPHNAHSVYQQQHPPQHMYHPPPPPPASSHYHTTQAAPYDYQAYYQLMSANHINRGQLQSSGPAQPPPDLKPVVDKTAEYVAKNGDTFERTVLERHAGDSRFNFINPWDSYHAYYKMVKQWHRERLQQQTAAPGEEESSLHNNVNNKDEKSLNVQKLSESGAVSFKLQSKTTAASQPVVVDSSVNVFGHDDDDDNSTEQEQQGGGEGDEQETLDLEGEQTEGFSMAQQYDDNNLEGPPSKRRRTGKDKIGNKVQEFLSTVKAMFDVDDEDS